MAERAALYLRVSKDDDTQDPQNQEDELIVFCEREGYTVENVYVDRESGTKGRAERRAFDQLLEDAHGGHFDIVVFWALDRFSREGIRNTIAYLQQLDACGVDFRSKTEPYLNTENELVGNILVTVLSYLANLEAEKISRRTKAGLERAKKKGKSLGRPSKYEQNKEAVEAMVERGASTNEIAEELDLSWATANKYRQRLGG